MNKLFFVLVLLGLLFSCVPKNKDQGTPATETPSTTWNERDCRKPTNLNFKSIVFRAADGRAFYYTREPNLNNNGDDWKTDKIIPCYFKNLMDSSHAIINDSTIANDTLNDLFAYSNPAESGSFYFIIDVRRPALLHLLLVDEQSNVIYKKNEIISRKNYSNNRIEGLEDPPKGYNLDLTIDLNGNPKYKPGSYYRLYYYLSAKNNNCYHQGYGDVYVGKFFNF